MFRLQKNSLIVTLTPEITISEYESLLQVEGFTSGYSPVAGMDLDINYCLAHRSPNLYFLKYGGIEDLCVGGLIQTPQNKIFTLISSPRAATGPDLRKVMIGSENALGRFTEVTLKFFPIPEAVQWGLVLCPSKQVCYELLREMLGSFIQPIFAGCLDEEEAEKIMQILGLASEDKVILFFKLAGLKKMVEAEKVTIPTLIKNEEQVFYWPTRREDVEILDHELLTQENFYGLVNKFSPLVSAEPSEESKFEVNFKKYIEEFPC